MMTSALIVLRAYQRLISPFIGGNCRFTPTCSAYAIQALERHGALRAYAFGAHGGSFAAGHGGDVETTLSQIQPGVLFFAASKTVIEVQGFGSARAPGWRPCLMRALTVLFAAATSQAALGQPIQSPSPSAATV